MNILVCTAVFPSAQDLHEGAFVASAAQGLAQLGSSVTVIHPRSVWRGSKAGSSSSALPYENDLRILRPSYLSWSSRSLLGMSTFGLTKTCFSRAALRCARANQMAPTICYGHFLYFGGHAALTIGRYFGVPAVAAVGESTLSFYDQHGGRKQLIQDIAGYAGLLCVSDENKKYCTDKLAYPADQILVLPNAADSNLFHPRDKQATRSALGLPQQGLLAAFVGHFDERKGVNRVHASLESVRDVGGVYLGSGALKPCGSNVVFAQAVPHAKVAEYLAACDMLVLPTRAEGCPNVVVEAMASGLPIVGSDIPAMQQLVPESAGLLVPADDVQALAKAIRSLCEDEEKRNRMGEAAHKHARKFTLTHRCRAMQDWLAGIADASTHR